MSGDLSDLGSVGERSCLPRCSVCRVCFTLGRPMSQLRTLVVN